MSTLPFRQVDVFASTPFGGNPVAVVLGAADLTDAQMADVSDWTNLSECTFVLPPTTPEADYRVRIFTLRTELPFAGHPTLGTARAWLDAGGTPRDPARIVQECGAGLVPIRRDDARLAFAAPPTTRSGPVDEGELARYCDELGLARDDVVAAQWIDNGPGWVGLLLRSAEAVLAIEPRVTAGERFIGVAGPHGPGADADLEVRAFFTGGDGPLREDPVTGSLNASLAQWLTREGVLSAPYVAAQGAALGRTGRVTVEEADGELWIGGATDVSIRGEISI